MGIGAQGLLSRLRGASQYKPLECVKVIDSLDSRSEGSLGAKDCTQDVASLRASSRFEKSAVIQTRLLSARCALASALRRP